MATKTVKKPKTTTNKTTTVELPTVRADTTTTEWATAVLKTIGAPVTTNNVNNMKLWMASEEPASSWLTYNNPLNTTYDSTTGGPAHYKTIVDGITATAETLKLPAYTSIVAALRANAPTKVFKAAVVQSPWAGSHYSSKGTTNGANFATTPLNAYATSSGGTPLSVVGGILNHIPLDIVTVPTGLTPVSPSISLGAAGAGVTSDAEGALSSLSGLAKIEGELTSSAFWKRIGVGTLGVGLVITGIILFVVTSKTGEKTVDTAAKAV